MKSAIFMVVTVMKIARQGLTDEVLRLLRRASVVSILGPRQVGKTTLARDVAARFAGAVTHFDLEHCAPHRASVTFGQRTRVRRSTCSSRTGRADWASSSSAPRARR